MESYLAEKDAVAGIRLTDGSRADRMRAMVDSFIALKRNRLLQNSSKMDFFGSGASQEKLICVKSGLNGISVAITKLMEIGKGDRGFLIMEYPLLREGKYYYLNPAADPTRSPELPMVGVLPPELAQYVDRKATMTITPYTVLVDYKPVGSSTKKSPTQ